MNSSQSIGALAAALVKAQSAIQGAKKDTANPFFKSKYADLSSVVDAIKKPATDNGLTWTQVMHDADNAAKVETIILHSSGEWLSCGVISVPVSKHDAQGYGSALTYARRYSLSAAFGVAPEDDDGNAAAAAAPKKDTVAALAAAKVTPVAGSLDALSPDAQKRAKAIANSVVDLWNEGKEFAAYEQVYQAGYDNDFILGLWEVLGPFPTIRNKLKKMDKESQLAQTA
jgi:hypothetical protein